MRLIPSTIIVTTDWETLRMEEDVKPGSSMKWFVVGAFTLAAGIFVCILLSPGPFLRSAMSANQPACPANCKAYAEAQEIYHRVDYDGDGVLEYSQSLKGDYSLLERKSGSADLALIDKTFAGAEGLPGVATPKAGYVFKVLKAQGTHAKGGQKSFIDANGNMTLGFALIGCPGAYDGTGKESYIVNQDGDVYFKDLGPDTPAIMERMTEYDPDETWEKWN